MGYTAVNRKGFEIWGAAARIYGLPAEWGSRLRGEIRIPIPSVG